MFSFGCGRNRYLLEKIIFKVHIQNIPQKFLFRLLDPEINRRYMTTQLVHLVGLTGAT